MKRRSDALQPHNGRPAIGVDVGQDVAAGGQSCRFPGDNQTLHRFVYHPDTRNAPSQLTRRVGAGVVDDDDLVRLTRLREESVKTAGKV